MEDGRRVRVGDLMSEPIGVAVVHQLMELFVADADAEEGSDQQLKDRMEKFKRRTDRHHYDLLIVNKEGVESGMPFVLLYSLFINSLQSSLDR